MRTLTMKEAAAFLKIHPETLRKMKQIQRARIGRAFVFIEDDLLAYLRSQYEPQAQGEQEGLKCSNLRNEKTARIGGLREQQQVGNEYASLLGLPTGERLTNTGRSLKRIAGGRKG
jgi:hypothetical protein